MATFTYDGAGNIVQTLVATQQAPGALGVVAPLTNAALQPAFIPKAANTGSGVVLNAVPIVFSGNYQGFISNPA